MTTLSTQRFACGAIAAAVLAVAPGCKTTGPLQQSQQQQGQPQQTAAAPVQLTAAEQQMRADEKRFNNTVIGGVLTGAAVGAGVGFLAGVLSGGNSKEIRNTTVAGAVAGGVIGGIDGYVTAKKEQAGRNEIRTLQAATQDVKTDNQKLQAFLDSSSTVLAEGKARLSALKGDVAAKKLTAQQADEARKREEANIAAMNTTLAQAKKTRDQYAQAAAQFNGPAQNKRDLDAEIARMNQQVGQLEGNISEYNKALAVSRA
jgi:uncharacterized protein YcfJ